MKIYDGKRPTNTVFFAVLYRLLWHDWHLFVIKPPNYTACFYLLLTAISRLINFARQMMDDVISCKTGHPTIIAVLVVHVSTPNLWKDTP